MCKDFWDKDPPGFLRLNHLLHLQSRLLLFPHLLSLRQHPALSRLGRVFGSSKATPWLCAWFPWASPLPAERPTHRLDSTPSMSPGLSQVLNKLSAYELCKGIYNTLGPTPCWGPGQGEKWGQNPWPPSRLERSDNCSCKEVPATGRKTAVALGIWGEHSHLPFLLSLLPSQHHSANSQGLNNTCIQAICCLVNVLIYD